jgi:hypothetical protein
VRLAAAVTFLLAAIATWPAVFEPGAGLIGHPGNDVWNHVWGYWWVGTRILEGELPLQTDLLRFPGTSRLFFIDTFGAILTLPIQVIFGPIVAYNAAVFGCFWVAGLGAWALARHVLTEMYGSGDREALLAAAAFSLSPHLLAQAYNGISETLTAGALPLATLTALRLYARPRPGRALATGAAFGLCMIANWYYGLFAAMGAILLLLTTAMTRWRRVDWRALPVSGGAAGALALALVAPVLAGFSASLQGDEAIVRRDPEFVWNSLITHNITDVISLFHPGKFYSPDLKLLHGEDLLIVTYLGWTLLFLAVAGMARLRRWRDRLPWVVWIGFYGLLMLGPYLYVDGSYVTVADRRIPLPFLLFFDAFPAFQRISHPFRFVVPVQLALAVFAAIALRGLPRWTALAGSGAVLVESLALSPAPWPLPLSAAPIPSWCEEVREDPVPGAVLDLPITLPNLERAVYHYWQTAHGRPSPYSLNEPIPGLIERSRLARLLRVAEGGRLDRLPPMLPELDLVVSGRAMADLGVRYVILHDALYPPRRREQALTLLRVALGQEAWTTAEGDHIWRLDAPHPRTVP